MKASLGKSWGSFWSREMSRQASPSTCQSITSSARTSGQPCKHSAVIYTNTVMFPWCSWREAGPRCYLLNNYPVSQGQSSLQLCTKGCRLLLGALLHHGQLTGLIEMVALQVPTSRKDNCIKGWFFFFFCARVFLLGKIKWVLTSFCCPSFLFCWCRNDFVWVCSPRYVKISDVQDSLSVPGMGQGITHWGDLLHW